MLLILVAFSCDLATRTYLTTSLIMPRRCAAIGCSSVSGKGYSFHEFPRDDALHAKWARAVKLQLIGWKGLTMASFLCCKHFEPDCFVTEGIRYRNAVGIPAKNLLKPNAMPTIFLKSTDCYSQSTTPSQRPTSERRKCKAVSLTL